MAKKGRTDTPTTSSTIPSSFAGSKDEELLDDRTWGVMTLEKVCTGSLVLENILSYLDVPTLKACREVCSNWEETGLKLLGQQCYLNVQTFLESVVDVRDWNRVELYPNWTLDYNFFSDPTNYGERFLRMWGKGVKGLRIKNLTLDPPSIQWLRHILRCRCSSVVQIRLEFSESWERKLPYNYAEWMEYRSSIPSRRRRRNFKRIVESRRWHSYRPFHKMPNIESLTIAGYCDSMSCYFSWNFMKACVNLKHLFLPETASTETGGLELLRLLPTRPDMTQRLETFEWGLGRIGHGPERREKLYCYAEVVPVLAIAGRLRTGNIRFSNNLMSLHWDVMHVDRNGVLLSGVLDESVAANLRKLSFQKAVLNENALGQIANEILGGETLCAQIVHINFPVMPKLTVIEIGMRACYTISLSNLVDAAPNLKSLEITGCECCDLMDHSPCYHIWQGSSLSSMQNVHPNLKTLKAGVSMRCRSIIQETANKFPNLEELWMGHGTGGKWRTRLDMTKVFRKIKEFKSLKRFRWTHRGRVALADLIDNLGDAAKLECLNCYHLEIIQEEGYEGHVGLKSYIGRKAKLLQKLIQTRDSPCRFFVSWNSDNLMGSKRGMKCAVKTHEKWKCNETIQQLLDCVRRYNLRIEFSKVKK
jgi:hypothetical protein